MTRVRLESPIPDELSPDRSTCEHCGVAISWGDLGYTHDTSGFGDCGVEISGGDIAVAGFSLNPKIKLTRRDGVAAEPVEWYVDA